MKHLAVAVLVLMFASCGIQHLRIEKRHYRNGFYVHRASPSRMADTTFGAFSHEKTGEQSIDSSETLVVPDVQIPKAQTRAEMKSEAVVNQSDHTARDSNEYRSIPSNSLAPVDTGTTAVPPKNDTTHDFWLNVLAVFILIVIAVLVPSGVIGMLAAVGFYSQNTLLEKLAPALLLLGLLAFIAEIIALILLSAANPLWLPIAIITAVIALICVPFLYKEINS